MTARLTLAASQPREGADAELGDAQTKRLADLLLEVARCVNNDVAAVLPSRLEEDLRLEALRSVLIERERAALARLQQKFDDPEQFAEAVSGVLASAFALAGRGDERLAAVIAPDDGAGDAGVDSQGSEHHGRNPLSVDGPRHPQVDRGESRRDAARAQSGFQAQSLVAGAEVAPGGVSQRRELRRRRAQAHGGLSCRARVSHPSQDRAPARTRGRAGGGRTGSASRIEHACRDPGFRARLLQRERQEWGRRHRQRASRRPPAVVRGRALSAACRRDPRQSAGCAARRSAGDARAHPRGTAHRARRLQRRQCVRWATSPDACSPVCRNRNSLAKKASRPGSGRCRSL